MILKKKTSIKYKTLNPYYNESFQFKIPPDHMQVKKCSLNSQMDKISVFYVIGEGSISLEDEFCCG